MDILFVLLTDAQKMMTAAGWTIRARGETGMAGAGAQRAAERILELDGSVGCRTSGSEKRSSRTNK
jgi:hypothetical protein